MFTLRKLPRRKCGASIIGASILGGSALLGTAATVATNKSNQSYGEAQSGAQRVWSTNERLATQAYNTSERLATQAYNSPQNQVMMLRQAGLNPSALGNAVSFQGSQPQSSSAGSGGISPMGTMQVPNIPQLISSGSDLVNALAKHDETKASLPLLGEQVKYYIQKTFGEQVNNDILKLDKQLKQSTLPANVKSAFENLAKLEFDKVVSQNLGEKYRNESDLLKAQEQVEQVMKNLKGQELVQAQYLTSEWHRINNAMINLQKAQTRQANTQSQANVANARFANSQAFEKEMSNEIKKATQPYDIDNALYNADVITFLQQSSDKEQLFQQLSRDIKLSSAYKNSSNKQKIDATIENLRKLLGVSIGISAHN